MTVIPAYSEGSTTSAVSSVGKKHDKGKPQYSLLPVKPLREVVRTLTAGGAEYGRDNWKEVEGAEIRYMDALMRHVEAVRDGDVFDDGELGLGPDYYHLAGVVSNSLFLMHFQIEAQQSIPMISQIEAFEVAFIRNQPGHIMGYHHQFSCLEKVDGAYVDITVQTMFEGWKLAEGG